MTPAGVEGRRLRRAFRASLPSYEGRQEEAEAPGQVPIDATIEIASPPFGRQVSERIRAVAQAAMNLASEVAAGREDVTKFDEDPASTGNATEVGALAQLGGGLARSYQVRFTSSPIVSRLKRMARPEDAGHSLTTYEIPIEGRDEWLAAARRLA